MSNAKALFFILPAKLYSIGVLCAYKLFSQTTINGIFFFDMKFSVSYTTRSPRPGENHGINYFFVSKNDF
jgi:hypothetical protein